MPFLSFFALFPLLSLTFFLPLSAALAQDKPLPAKPAFLENLAIDGAQIRYLGNDGGMDGWIAMMRGQEQFFYVTPDGRTAVTGILLDADGRNLSLKQVYDLQQKNGGEMLDFFSDTPAPQAEETDDTPPSFSDAFKTPSEQLFAQIEKSNWIPLSAQNQGPVVYSFVDAQCPHCHAYLNELRQKGYLDDGTIQLRIVPVGIRPDTQAQAALLLALPNPRERFFRYLDGDDSALPVSKNLNEQGALHNKAIMLSWKLSATPLTIYRDRHEQVKIVEGRPNLASLIKDLPTSK